MLLISDVPTPSPVPDGEDRRGVAQIDEFTTFKFIAGQEKTVSGPGGLMHWFWRDYALELSPSLSPQRYTPRCPRGREIS